MSDLMPQAAAGGGRVPAESFFNRSKLAVPRDESIVFFIIGRPKLKITL
jgi:hypothetical protein